MICESINNRKSVGGLKCFFCNFMNANQLMLCGDIQPTLLIDNSQLPKIFWIHNTEKEKIRSGTLWMQLCMSLKQDASGVCSPRTFRLTTSSSITSTNESARARSRSWRKCFIGRSTGRWGGKRIQGTEDCRCRPAETGRRVLGGPRAGWVLKESSRPCRSAGLPSGLSRGWKVFGELPWTMSSIPIPAWRWYNSLSADLCI